MKKLLLLFPLTLGVAGIFFLTLRGCLSRYDRYETLPNTMLFEKNGKTIVFNILKYGKTNSYSQKRGMTSIAMSTTFYLQQYDPATMEKTKEIKWKKLKDLKNGTVKILGRSSDYIWVFADELLALDPFALTIAADNHTIASMNPILKGMLLTNEQYYQWNYFNGSILIKASDGTDWQLYPNTLKAAPFDGKIDELNYKEAFSAIRNIWESSLSPSWITNQDTLFEQFYGLYDASEIKTQATNFRNDAASSEGVRRFLWKAALVAYNGYLAIDYEKAAKLATASFLDGCFLRNKYTAKAIHPGSGAFIILHHDKLGEGSSWQVSRVTTDGKVSWTTNTLSARLVSTDINGKYLLLQCTTGAQSQSSGNKLISIRLKDGATQSYDYLSNK